MSEHAQHQVIVTDVRVEHHHDAFGVQHIKPRISWRFAWADSSRRIDWQQQAYDIKVDETIYHVQSDGSILQPWPAAPLASRQRTMIQVRCYGAGESTANNAPTAWSMPLRVEAALTERSDWQASMITSPKQTLTSNGSLCPIAFRKTFSIPMSTITQGRLYITAHGVYEAKLNGQVIGDHCMAPDWSSYRHNLYYRTFDVTSMLKIQNVLTVEVGAGWYASALGWRGGRRCRYGSELGVLAQLEVESSDQTIFICSDESWKCTASSIVSSELYNGETLNANEQDCMRGWGDSSEYDQSHWDTVRVVNFPAANLIAPDFAPVRVTEVVQPRHAFKSASGKIIIDFGQNLVGRLRVKRIAKHSGDVVSFQHAEVMEQGELGTRPLREARSTDKIICASVELHDWYPKFTFHGFRYVQVDGWIHDPAEYLINNLLVAEVMHTDLERTGEFYCSHPLINKLHENAVWSMRGNFLSIPTDCPQRDERLGWTGDIQVFASSAAFLYNVTGMLGHWLQNLASEQLVEGRGGIPPLVVPSVIEKETADDHFWPVVPQAIWGDATVLVPWDLFQASADVKLLQQQYQSMKAWLEDGIPRGKDDLWDENTWQLGDWLDPNAPPDDPGDGRTDGTLIADAYLVHVSRIFVEVSKVLNLSYEDQEFRYQAIKSAFQQKYITSQGLLVGDTQTALALSIFLNLHGSDAHKITASERLARLVRKSQFKIATGFAGTPIICHALTVASQTQLAYAMVQNPARPSWLYQVQLGATTMWERWDSMLPDKTVNPGEMTSFNHYALGSVVSWLHKSVAGISPLSPGWKRVKVQPIPGGTVTSASVRLLSPYGLVRCDWMVKDGTFELQLEVPPNCSAEVHLPNSDHAESTQAGAEAEGVGSGFHIRRCAFTMPDWPPLASLPPFWSQKQPEFV